MRCRLSRPCIRWLKYMVVISIIAFIFSLGFVNFSSGNISAYNEESGNGLITYDTYEDVVELGDDYDTVKEPMREVFAKIDETLRLEQEALYQYPEESMEENMRDYDEQIIIENKKVDSYVREHSKESRKIVKSARFSFSKEDEKELSKTLTVLINSYGVNRSTVIDDLFRERPGVLIFKEPSLTLRPLWYFRGDNYLCSMRDPSCVLAGEETSDSVNHCLSGLAGCSLGAIANCIGPSGTIIHTGIREYRACKTKAVTEKAMIKCHRFLQSMCKEAKVKVIQVRNLAMDVPLKAQRFINNLMVGHVFRDARQVVYSEKMAKPLYLSEQGDVFFHRISSLCNRIQYDLRTLAENQNLKANLNFFSITNEELLIDADSSLEKLSKLFAQLNALSSNFNVFDTIKNNAFEIISKQIQFYEMNDWGPNMDESVISLAAEVCADVYKILGYKLT